MIMKNYEFAIKIEGRYNPKEFTEKWSGTYSYKLEPKYKNNIKAGFDSDFSLLELMRWKNGTGDNIAKNKSVLVDYFIRERESLKTLKNNFDLTEFEKKFKPDKKSSIWTIFILHIMNPDKYPIFDQHAYRSFNFFQTGDIKELPSEKYKEIYRIYKEEYSPWFNELKAEYELDPRKIDQSLFSFGQVLKKIKGFPLIILNKSN